MVHDSPAPSRALHFTANLVGFRRTSVQRRRAIRRVFRGRRRDNLMQRQGRRATNWRANGRQSPMRVPECVIL